MRTGLLKRVALSVVAVCLSVFVSFAGTDEALSRKLDTLRKIGGSVTFAVIGDTRSGGSDYQDLLNRLMKYNPGFVANTGDMVNSPGKRQWAAFRKQSEFVTVPYFLTVGNHDVRDRESEDLYRKQLDLPGNKLYYSFTAGNSLYVFLDSNIPGQDRKITGEQYEWLKNVLSTSGGKHKFVFVHHPLYPDKERGFHYGGCLDKYPKERDRLERLFEKQKVTMVFTGHEHLYSRKKIGSVMHIITGGGGGMLYTEEAEGGFYHFILMTVDGSDVRGEVIDINGNVKDTFQIKE